MPDTAVASVEMIPFITLALEVGDTYQLSAIPHDANGHAITGLTITWTSSAAEVAKVSSTGLVTAMAPGSAMITATVQGKSGHVGVEVAPIRMRVAPRGTRSSQLMRGGT